MQPWKTLARTTAYQPSEGRWITVEEHTIELPDGQIIDDWPWVITPDFVNVSLVTEAGEFVCFRQTKYAVDGESLAVVGGYLEPGEDPLEAAKREVLEETGYAATDWVALGKYAIDGNRGSGNAHLYLARNARWVQPIDADDLEEMEMVLLSRAEVEAALHDGEFKVLPWAAAIGLALAQLNATS